MTHNQKASEKFDTDSADNATATATIAAPSAGSSANFITSVAGGFDAAVAGNTLILKEGSTELARWIVHNSFALSLPNPIPVYGVANLELEASGTGGVSGTATITGYTI